MQTRLHRLIVLTVAVWVAVSSHALRPLAAPRSLPDRLSDQEFWRLSSEFSEANGYFQSDNLVSNERSFQYVVPVLQRQKGRGAYLGVAPDQNFAFIVALEPKIAFIVDIRRGNLHAHLMYKALVELSSDRADFYSRLFARKRPAGLGAMSTVQDIAAAFATAPASEALSRENLKAIEDHLVKKHGFPLGDEDLKGIEYIYGMFVQFGPTITYQSSNRGRFGFGNMPSYAELQMATDAEGQNRSYLASEENFRFLKSFEAKNLLVPVVGDFAGPEGSARRRPVPRRPRCDRQRVLSVERGAVSLPERGLAELLQKRRGVAARRLERVHPFDWRRGSARPDQALRQGRHRRQDPDLHRPA